jgi:hypothetical protein
LTRLSLERLFGLREYHAHVHSAVSQLFDTLTYSQSTIDDVSKSAVVLFNQLILSSYRHFMTNDDQLVLDEKFEKCLINKAFEIEALPAQRELLYALTSGSSLLQIVRTMLIYVDADLQRLKSSTSITTNVCTQRYARETLCSICVSSTNLNTTLCPNVCRSILRTCFEQNDNPYLTFATLAKGYSAIVHEIEQALTEVKVNMMER